MQKFHQEVTGAMRESINTKIDTHLVPYELIVAAATGLNYGATKYSARNFEQGLSYVSLLGSIERHCRALMDGEFYDGESALPHFTLLASSVAMLCHNIMQGRVIENLGPPKEGLSISWLAVEAQRVLNQAAGIASSGPDSPVCNPYPTPNQKVR